MKTAHRVGGLRHLVWLASYPKSGNTWTRMLLASFLADSEQPVSINEVAEHLLWVGSSGRSNFEHAIGMAAEKFTGDEAETFLPTLHRLRAAHAADAGKMLFCKTPNAIRNTSVREFLVPEAIAAGAL